MRGNIDPSELLYEPEIEKLARKTRQEAQSRKKESLAQSSEASNMENYGVNNMEGEKSIKDYAYPNTTGCTSSIVKPPMQATNFEIKPSLLNIVLHNQFGGEPLEDPNAHITNFIDVCDMMKYNGVSDDAIRLRLFPFSLRDKAKGWLMNQPQGSITTWEDLQKKFLDQFFPPSKSSKLRSEINSFYQKEGENLYEAWERFKELIRKCPRHNLHEWQQIQIFHDGMTPHTKYMVDAAAGGSLIVKTPTEAKELIEIMAAGHHTTNYERGPVKKGMLELDTLNLLLAQNEALTRKVDSLVSKQNEQAQVKSVSPSELKCDFCGGAHVNECCNDTSTIEQLNYMGGAQRSHNNPYSNTYNQGWKNHPNFSWGNNQEIPSSSFAGKPSYPPGFQQPHQYAPQHRAPSPPVEKKPSMEEMFMQYMAKNEAMIQTQNAAIKNLETQVGQLANALNSRQQGNLPSDTENNPRREGKEHCKAISLRSGKQIPEVSTSEAKEKVVEEQLLQKGVVLNKETQDLSDKKETKAQEKENNTPTPSKITPPIPFPQRFRKHNLDRQYKKFLEILKQLHINIPFAEALEQMPSYAKFMKEVLSRKKRLSEFETVALTEECSAILQKKLPMKMQDPGSFVIPCNIGKNFTGNALCDLGASVNLMPLTIFKKLGLGEARPTTVTLQLADRSLCYPNGIIEDVLIKVDKLIFSADFIVLDYEEDKEIPIILGRPFLATGKTLIDVYKGELTMRVNDQEVTFNMNKVMKAPSE